ncbi:MFS transporter [Streptomyces camponoticapitis]|uniref:MFS transporter n=2 Tax=Streptomyces camponoticapitis TaxID=1616125 RepID=A0ABQ2EPL8_9ACTN|nr:MFS transporter [Streptomyces camponoticapitis]
MRKPGGRTAGEKGTGSASERRRTLLPLVGVLTAMAVSLTGTRVSAIALPWFVLVSTGSATQTGVVAFCEMAPYVVVKAFTGPLVDRAGPRTISWTTDLVSSAAAFAVPVLHAADLLSFPLLLVLVALIGAARGPGDLAKDVMVPEAADHGRVPLERATGFAGVTERLAATLGPAAGGALIALLGPLTGLTVNAACFALGSVIIGLVLPRGMGLPVPHPPSPRDAADTPAEPGYWRRFGQGFTFLRSEPLLLTIVVMVMITNFLDAAFSAVLLPVWAKESGNGPSAIGLCAGAGGLAAIGGSLIAAGVAHRMRRRLVFFAGFLLAGAPRWLILASPAPLWTVVVVFAIGGFGAGFLNPILAAVSYERVPRRLLGRVKALSGALSWSGMPLGGLIGGAAVASIGLAPVLLVGGAAYFLTTNLTGLRPEWREMDRLRGKGRAADDPALPTPRRTPDSAKEPEPGAGLTRNVR